MEGPLAGIRVLDLTSAWAGPMAGRILAALGAEVVHIEGPNRMDGWRGARDGGDESLYPDRDPGPRPYNRSCMFNSQNLSKLSLVIDLKADDASAVMRRLVATSDLVLSNFSPGTLDRLGYGYQSLREIRPDIVVVEMPAFGNTGPMATMGALGPTMELGSGMASLIGYGDGEPIATGPAYMDPIGAYNGAAACVTALLHRQRTGRGQYVEVAQTEAGMQWIGEEILAVREGGPVPQPDGNHVRWAAPHDCFPCAGDDAWVAIAATSDEEWRALCRVMDRHDLLGDPVLATLGGRLSSQERLGREISAWTVARSKFDAADALQRAGVPAAPVMTGKDAFESPYLESREFFTELEHPEAGRHRYQGLPFQFSRTPAVPRSAAPCFGEHTAYVLSQIAGLSSAEIEVLARAGTIVIAKPVGGEGTLAETVNTDSAVPSNETPET